MKVAHCAVARNRLHLAWAVVKQQQPVAPHPGMRVSTQGQVVE